jgi:hypothetical protein
MVKRGVARLHVSQFALEETKRSPMVTQFLLHKAANMSIGGVSDKKKFGIGGGVLEWYRCGEEAFCIL